MKADKNKIMMIILIFIISLLCSCEIKIPNKDTVESWQKITYDIIPGYTGFQGHWLHGDIGAHISSYICPPDLTSNDAFSILENQNPEFHIHYESDTLLSLRRASSDYGPKAFTELRFLYDYSSGVMTVLLAYKNSEHPVSHYDRLLKLQKRYHRRRVLPRELLLTSR